MQLAVTIKQNEDVDQLKSLLDEVRKVLDSENVTILEAPKGLNYAYPFPVVTVSDGPQQGRHFGDEAISLLRSISESR